MLSYVNDSIYSQIDKTKIIQCQPMYMIQFTPKLRKLWSYNVLIYVNDSIYSKIDRTMIIQCYPM